MSKRTTPELRQRLYELAEEHALPELAVIADELRRRFHGRKAKAHCTPVTSELREAIRSFAAAHPEMSELQIANHFGVNQGRVSEALYGKRGES